MGEWIDTFSIRPKRGELISAMNPAEHESGRGHHEVFCHPDDTQAWLDGGISKVNGLPVRVEVVERWPFADHLRITFRHGPVDLETREDA